MSHVFFSSVLFICFVFIDTPGQTPTVSQQRPKINSDEESTHARTHTSWSTQRCFQNHECVIWSRVCKIILTQCNHYNIIIPKRLLIQISLAVAFLRGRFAASASQLLSTADTTVSSDFLQVCDEHLECCATAAAEQTLLLLGQGPLRAVAAGSVCLLVAH